MLENANPYYVADGKTDRERFIDQWAPTCGKAEAERSWEEKQAGMHREASMVMGDIKPYISMIDGSRIESRSRHRTHLKDHGCIEIGNETKYLKHDKPLRSPKGLKEKLIHEVNTKLRSQL